MNGIIKRIGGWVAAVLVATAFAVIFQTQNLLARLNDIGAEIGFAKRASTTLYDLRYLGSLYIIFIGIALAAAFLVGGGLFKLTKISRSLIYSSAGAIAMLIMLLGMKQAFFDVHLIAGARDNLGIGLQMLAGAMGGFVFARVNEHKEKDLRV